MRRIIVTFAAAMVLFSSCIKRSCVQQNMVSHDIKVAEQQVGYQLQVVEKSGKILFPRTVFDNEIQYAPIDDWTSGFFPGALWYMYELTGNKKWENAAEKFTLRLDSVKYITWHHDVGFIIHSSYGIGYDITKNPAYKAVIIQAAKSLATRFRPVPGVIQSWDENRGWQAKRGWMCPVIIDNMMNLELLFQASDLSGDSTYRKMAISHANVTMANHFRKDFSCYHVVDYDKIKGGVRSKGTAQGFSDESSWARGQAWALYGFTICYRETKDPKYLDLVDKIYHFIFTNKTMPADLVPYWDFNAPNIPNEPRDASSAAIMASALYELVALGRPQYKETADKIMQSLSGPAYLAIVGTNGNFLLMHSVGSIPHDSEVDVPLIYADYYFLEALARKIELEKSEKK